jgi:hypothetical protein
MQAGIQTNRQTDKLTFIQDRQTEKQAMDTQTGMQTGIQTGIQRDKLTYIQDRQKEKAGNRQTGMQAGKQTNRDKQTDIRID